MTNSFNILPLCAAAARPTVGRLVVPAPAMNLGRGTKALSRGEFEA
jgi:hypothetical protein